MKFDLTKIEALTAMMAAELAGEAFDRDAACHLANEIRRDFPNIGETMAQVVDRLSRKRH